MPDARTAIAHPLGLPLYDLGEDHPMTTVRYRLALELIRAYGLLDRPDVELLDPVPASVEEITRVHAPAYVRAVRRYSDDPVLGHTLEARQWGLTPGGDTPPVPGNSRRPVSCSEMVITRGSSQKMFCVPSPWWASTST